MEPDSWKRRGERGKGEDRLARDMVAVEAVSRSLHLLGIYIRFDLWFKFFSLYFLWFCLELVSEVGIIWAFYFILLYFILFWLWCVVGIGGKGGKGGFHLADTMTFACLLEMDVWVDA